MAMFDNIMGAFNRQKKKKENKNTTVQSQAEEQGKINKPSAKQTNYDRLMSAREKAGGSLAKNTGAYAFGEAGKKLDTATQRRNLKGESDYEEFARSKGYSDEDIAYAKQGWQNRYNQLKQNWDANPNPVKNVNPDKLSDNWTEFLPRQEKQNFLERTYNDIKTGALTNQQGNVGLATALGDLSGNDEYAQRKIDEARYLQDTIERANQGNPQTMYDRILTNAVNNGINALRTSALTGGLGLPNDLAKVAGLGNMAGNVFGNAYGQVRTGMKGEQYQDDTGAALRYGLANAGSELAQELVDPFHFVPGADTPTIGNFLGEFGQEAFGAALDPYLETVIGNDPLTQTEDWTQALGQTARSMHQDENGNWNPMMSFNRIKDIAQQGFEGGIGGVAGGMATNPVQSVQQFGADIRSIQNAKGAQRAIESYDNSRADLDAIKKGSTDIDPKWASRIAEENVGNMRAYIQDGLRSASENYRKTAGEANRRVAEYTGEQNGVKNADIQSMVDISNKLGVALEFADANDAVLGGRDAVYQDGKVILNAKASNPYETLFAHEMAHSTEGSNDYQNYADQLDRLVQDGIIEDVNLSGEERYAVLTEKLLSDKRTLQDVANYDDSTLKYLAGQLKATITGDRSSKALNKTMRALNGAIEQAKYQAHDRTQYYTKDQWKQVLEAHAKGQNKLAYLNDTDGNGFSAWVANIMSGDGSGVGYGEGQELINYLMTNGGPTDENIDAFSKEMLKIDPGYRGILLNQEHKVEDLRNAWDAMEEYFGEPEAKTKPKAEAKTEAKPKKKKVKEDVDSRDAALMDEYDTANANYWDLSKISQVKRGDQELKDAVTKNFKMSPEHADMVIEAVKANNGKATPAMISDLVSKGVTELNRKGFETSLANRLTATYEGYSAKSNKQSSSPLVNTDTSALDGIEGPSDEVLSELEKSNKLSAIDADEQAEIERKEKEAAELDEKIKAEEAKYEEEQKPLRKRKATLSVSANRLSKATYSKTKSGGGKVVIENNVYTNETVNDVLNNYKRDFIDAYNSLENAEKENKLTEELVEEAERSYAIYKDIYQNGENAEYFKQDGFGAVARDKDIKARPSEYNEEFQELDQKREELIYGPGGDFEETAEWQKLSPEEKIELTKSVYRQTAEEATPKKTAEKPAKKASKKAKEKVAAPVEEKVEAPVEEKVEAPAEEESYNPDSMYEDDYDEEAIAAADAEARAEEAAKEEVKEPEVAAEEAKADETLAGIFKDNGVSDELSTALTTDFNGNFIKAKEQLSKATGLGYKAAEKVLKDIKRTYDDGMAKGQSIEEINSAINEKLDKAKELDQARKEQKQAEQNANKEAYKKSKEAKPVVEAKTETKAEAQEEAKTEAKAEPKKKVYKDKNAYQKAQEEAKAEEDRQNAAAEKYMKDIRDARNYAQDFSPMATAKRIRDMLNPEMQALVDETFALKEVVHDKDAQSLADQWFEEDGVPGAIELANNIVKGRAGPTVEIVKYLDKAMQVKDKLAHDTQVEVDKIVDFAEENKIEIDNAKGQFIKDGKQLDSIEIDGRKVTFDEFDGLKNLSKYARDDGEKILDGLTRAATETGRTMRALRYITPGNPSRTNRLIDNFIEALKKENYKILEKKKIELTVSDDLREALANAKTHEARRKAMDAIEDSLAKQIPSTFSERLKQWRMLNMLMNTRTHIRNVVSNAYTYGMFGLTDMTQRVVENMAVEKGLLTEEERLTDKKPGGLKDYKAFAKQIREETGYTDGVSAEKFDLASARIRKGAFNSRFMQWHNALSKANSDLLEFEDELFVGARADKVFAMKLKQQGYSISNENGKLTAVDKNGKAISEDALNKIQEDARKSAEEATYHDFNKIASAINKFKRDNKKAGAVVDIILPFTKTPANILKRTYEFTPANLMFNTAYNLDRVKQGKMSASEAITQISRGLTGTALQAAVAMLGVALKDMDILSTPDDDDEETKYYKQNIFGKQNYALHIGDEYYSIDWAYPSVGPLVQGAILADVLSQKSDNPIEMLGKIGIAEIESFMPILEASYLQSVADTFDAAIQGFNYGGEIFDGGLSGGAERLAESVAENLAGQMLPTAGGAANRILDPVKRTTSGNTTFERIVNRSLMNIPGGSWFLEPAIDQKGNVIKYDIPLQDRIFNNLYNPATVTYDKHDKVDEELVRIGKEALPKTQTGQGGLKSAIKKNLKEDFKLGIGALKPGDYTKVKQTYYGNYNQYVKDYNELAAYNNLGTTVRDSIYNDLEQLALAEGKITYYDKVGGDPNALLTDEQKVALDLKSKGVSPAEFYLMKANGLKGNRGALYAYQELESMGAIDSVVDGIRAGKYSASAAGLSEGILKKTALQRDDMVHDFIGEDSETLESQAATYRLRKGTEAYEAEQALKKSKDSAEHLEKLDDDIDTKIAKQEFFEDRAIKAGLTGKQFYDYQDIKGTEGVSSSRSVKVIEQMKNDDTWDSYRKAYNKGEIDKNDLSKLGITESMMKWTDDAIDKAIAAMNNGSFTGLSDFKSAYKKAMGVSVEGKASSSSSSKKSSSSSKTSKEQKAMAKLFKDAIGSGSGSSGISADIKSSAALFDSIVNSSKSDVERLRKELKL